MPQAYPPNPSLMAMERPRCPECQARTMLASVEPGPDGPNLLSFKCVKCESEAQSAAVVIASASRLSRLIQSPSPTDAAHRLGGSPA